MLIKLEDTGCNRCKSSDTRVEILAPDNQIKRSTTGDYSTEIFCKDCGKINRTQLRVEFN